MNNRMHRENENGPRGTTDRRPRGQRDIAPTDFIRSGVDGESFSRRAVLGGLFGAALVLGVGKLVDYQIVNRDAYLEQADMRRRIGATLFAKRGTIYDRNGNVLAASAECSNVYVNPQRIESRKKAARALVDVLGIDRKFAAEVVSGEGTFAYVKRLVDREDCDRLAEKDIAGIEFEPAVKRVYPYGPLAAQVLGAVGFDNKGISGLEGYYDDILTGSDGYVERESGAGGSFIAGGDYEKTPATDGGDIVLSIDADIQQAAEEAMAKAVEDSGAKYGSAIVVDPTTGDILAACSYPTYDPSDLSTARAEDMNLRVVTDAYEPGSVFKALVCGMAIDMEKISPDTEFSVPASVLVGSDRVYDVDKRDYTMTMTTREIMRRSSNTGMVLVGKEIGADSFAKYLKKYGLGTKSGVDFPGESTGIIRKRSEYDGSSLGSMSFGQGIAVSPIELVRAMTGIANGGIMSTPHFLLSKKGEEVDWSSSQKRCISEEAARQVVSMMETVVAEGTGSAGQIDGYTIAGKTGTAERAGEGGYEELNNMASFLGFTSPDNPRAMVYITLDGTAYTSSVAMPPFKEIMRAAISSLGIKPDA
uniref:peptidoglycan D,D-transpeptidase FtsI family protein n=1 Tax=Collinsella sp. BA40 TaxID=2560852 RepID=UPI002107A4C7|nr:penicillin-binding protein 2 [Collinsella sp. BA40]